MATYDMGFFIRQIRLERGITQEQLCRGLCSISTLSRIERGQDIPSGYLFRIIMERLGNYYGRYYNVFLSKEDFDIWQKTENLHNAILKNDESLVESLLTEYCGIKSFNEGVGLQFIINCQISLAVMREENIRMEITTDNKTRANTAAYDDWLEKAYKSIRITIPEFDESKIGDYMLSYEEICAITCIGVSYFYKKDYDKTAATFKALITSMDKYCPDQLEKARYYPNILANLGETLFVQKSYDEVIDVCRNGWRFCIECGRAKEIPVFMSLYGKSLIEMGNPEDGKPLLYQTYCVALAHGKKEIVDMLRRYFARTFGEDIELYCERNTFRGFP